MIVGGVGNGPAEEDGHWDLNPGAAAIPERGPCSLGGERGENHMALAEWGPRGCNTADGAGSLNHGLLLLFLRYSAPDWAEGEGRTVRVSGYSKGL